MMGTRSQLLDPLTIVRASDIRSGHTVADLLCGHRGHCVFHAAQHAGDSGKVFAVDIRKKAVDTLQAIAETGYKGNIEIIRGDAQNPGSLPIEEDSVDRVLLVDALSLAKNPLSIVQHAKSLLKSGGTVTVVDWHTFGGHQFGPHINNRVSEQEARSICMVTGLELVGGFKAGDRHYAFVCKKI